MSARNQHSSTVHTTPSVAIDADDSSEEEEDSYTLEEAIHVWYEKKTRATRFSYNQYVKQFQSWLHVNYGRIIDHRLKKKHVKLVSCLETEDNDTDATSHLGFKITFQTSEKVKCNQERYFIGLRQCQDKASASRANHVRGDRQSHV